MLLDQPRYQMTAGRLCDVVHGPARSLLAHGVKQGQMLQYQIGGADEVDQAGDLVNPDLPQLINQAQALVRGPEQAACLEVALEGEVEDRVHLLRRQPVERKPALLIRAGALEGGERPGSSLDEAGRAQQILLHRGTNLLLDFVVAGANERV